MDSLSDEIVQLVRNLARESEEKEQIFRKIRELHRCVRDHPICEYRICNECGSEYPCRTRQALDD